MSRNSDTVFENFLQQHDEAAWAGALESLIPAIHEVDRNPTVIWFAFFPLGLARAFEQTDEPAQLAQKLLMQGEYRLPAQIDSSHTFLYGHRFWPKVKKAVAEHAATFTGMTQGTLADHIREVARGVASQIKVDETLLTGITAVALMTLRQVGPDAFKAAPGEVRVDQRNARKSPEKILRERAKDDGQGMLGFLRTTDKQWTVVWNEDDPTARFKMLHRQEIASAAATDPRDWSQIEPRCTINEGPIPVQCRSASCGTCWVGVLGGAEKLSEVSVRERKAMQLFGYIDTDDPKPLIRLSCQAQGEGAVSVVIPSWNGVFGKYLRQLKDGEAAEPVRETQEAAR